MMVLLAAQNQGRGYLPPGKCFLSLLQPKFSMQLVHKSEDHCDRKQIIIKSEREIYVREDYQVNKDKQWKVNGLVYCYSCNS